MYIWRKRITPDWLEQRSEDLLRRFGSALSIINRPGKARTIVEVPCTARREATQLQDEFGGTIEKLRAGWLKQFAKQFAAKPLKIGSRLTVTGTAKLPLANTIFIPAEAAFGTGEHATTAMCLRLLEQRTRDWKPGWTMLDAGTGSGILAIAGRRFGAKRIVAIDNDPIACSVAQRNARTNGVGGIEFREGDALRQRLAGKFDVITANLFSEILVDAMPIWARHLAKNGCLILSGILRSQEAAVVAALRRNGFAPEETKRRGKWVALLAFQTRKKS
jgi:ribosomal protein L11 methyltransferase